MGASSPPFAPRLRSIPPAAVGITFVVKEGPKVKVGRIKFVGNRNINARTLRAAMKNLKPIGVPHSIFLENIFSKTYDATKLEEDTERVRAEYQNRGYFKVLVQDPKTDIHDTGHPGVHIPLIQKGPGKAVDITMPIEEGDRYTLAGITFKNNKAISNVKALRSLFPIKDGDIFSREKIGKGLENLRKAYGEYGYINFTSVPDTRFDDEKKLIYLDIDVDEGKQFYVRRIEFQGNTTTRDKVIRREIALEEGQVYNSRLWEFSLLRLNQLGYFEQLKPDDPNTTDRKLDEKEGSVELTLKVKEKGKNSIGLNGGVSGLEGAFIGLSYTDQQLPRIGRNSADSSEHRQPDAQRSLRIYRALSVGSPVAGGIHRLHDPDQLQPGPAIRDSDRATVEPAFVLLAEPAELHPIEHGFYLVPELSAASLAEARGLDVLVRRFFADRAQRRLEGFVLQLGVPRHLRPQCPDRNHHQ